MSDLNLEKLLSVESFEMQRTQNIHLDNPFKLWNLSFTRTCLKQQRVPVKIVVYWCSQYWSYIWILHFNEYKLISTTTDVLNVQTAEIVFNNKGKFVQSRDMPKFAILSQVININFYRIFLYVQLINNIYRCKHKIIVEKAWFYMEENAFIFCKCFCA